MRPKPSAMVRSVCTLNPSSVFEPQPNAAVESEIHSPRLLERRKMRRPKTSQEEAEKQNRFGHFWLS